MTNPLLELKTLGKVAGSMTLTGGDCRMKVYSGSPILLTSCFSVLKASGRP